LDPALGRHKVILTLFLLDAEAKEESRRVVDPSVGVSTGREGDDEPMTALNTLTRIIGLLGGLSRTKGSLVLADSAEKSDFI